MTDAASDWVNIRGLADWFDSSVATVRRRLPGMYAEGFPRPVPGVEKWYLPTCREWARSRAAPSAASMDDPLMRALDGERPH